MIEGPTGSQELTYIFDRVGPPIGSICFFRAHIVPVNQGHVESRIRQSCRPSWTTTPDKAIILAHVKVCEAIASPKSSSVAQCAAGQPHSLVNRIDVLPGPFILCIIE